MSRYLKSNMRRLQAGIQCMVSKVTARLYLIIIILISPMSDLDLVAQQYENIADSIITLIEGQEDEEAKLGVIFSSAFYYDFAPFMRCLLYTSPSPRDQRGSRMPSSA